MKPAQVTLLILLSAAVLSSAAAVTARGRPASFRLPSPPESVDPALMSRVARAQAAATLTQHPIGAVAALVGF